MSPREESLFNLFRKDKIGLKEVINIDGESSLSKVTKILAKIGDEKAQENNVIPLIFKRNGKKRIFRIEDVAKWIDRTNI